MTLDKSNKGFFIKDSDENKVEVIAVKLIFINWFICI